MFASQAFGIPLGIQDYIMVVATATLASIGTAGVPSVGLITLSMVFNAVGLPIEGITLIMGIDRILDMLRTAVNVTGDAVCTTIVAVQDKEFNKDILRIIKIWGFYFRKVKIEALYFGEKILKICKKGHRFGKKICNIDIIHKKTLYFFSYE